MNCLVENVFHSYVVEKTGRDFDAVMEIYDRLFPETEKIPHEILLRIAQNEHGQLKVYKENDLLCGFTFSMKDEFFTYLMFFAVNDSMHSKGYGSRIIRLFKEENSGKPIVFAIEDPDENGAKNKEQRIRRQNFYTKNGFELTGTAMRSDKSKFLLMGTTHDVKSIYEKSEVFQHIMDDGGFELIF